MNLVNSPTFHRVCHYTSMTLLLHELNWWHNTCPVCWVGNGNPVNGDPLELNTMAFFDNLKKLSWCMNVGWTFNVNSFDLIMIYCDLFPLSTLS